MYLSYTTSIYTFPYVYTFPRSTAASSLQREVEEREEEFMVKPKEVALTYQHLILLSLHTSPRMSCS